LRAAGFTFTVMSWPSTRLPSGESAQDLVQRLATQSRTRAARAVGPAIVIAADTAVLIDNEILGKPGLPTTLAICSPNFPARHDVVTGVTVIRLPDPNAAPSSKPPSPLLPATPEELTNYLSTDEPFDKAGAYAIQAAPPATSPHRRLLLQRSRPPARPPLPQPHELGWSED